MNRTFMIARLTKDPAVTYSQSRNGNLAIARFNVATDRKGARKGDDVTADFFSCVAFGKTAEFIEKYLVKGTKVAIVGRFENNNYTDKNGNKVYSFQLVVEEVEFCESKKASQGDNAGTGNNTGAGSNDFLTVPEGMQEELPFA